MAKTLAEMNYLTTAEATQRLGVARSTLARWAKQGKLKKYYLGGKVLFKPSDLDALIKPEEVIVTPTPDAPSEAELADARLAYAELLEERKSGVKLSNIEDITQLAARILRESRYSS